MAIHLQTGKNTLQVESKEVKIHYLPFKIHADCDAKVDKYFNPYIKKQANGSKYLKSLKLKIFNFLYVSLQT